MNGNPPACPRGLIVSCQARPDNPLHGSAHMVAMALAAQQGGAAGIRAQGQADVAAIRAACPLPLIGLIKRPGHPDGVYITPDARDVTDLARAGADWIALDATLARPQAELRTMIQTAHDLGKQVLADIATMPEAERAAQLGADAVATTLHGYTPDTAHERTDEPNLPLIQALCTLHLPIPVWAEGRFHTPQQVSQALHLGAQAVVVGTAITNPREITRRFVQSLR